MRRTSAEYQHYFEEMGIAVTPRDLHRVRMWRLAGLVIFGLSACTAATLLVMAVRMVMR